MKKPGELTQPILDELLDDVVEVVGDDIAQAIVLLLERTKLVVEGAGAVGIAALMEGKIPGNGPVAVVLSGGNIDASTLITVMRYGVTLAGRHLVVRTHGARPAGRAAEAPPTCRRRTRQRPFSGASARGRGHPGRRDRHRPDPARARRRSTRRRS